MAPRADTANPRPRLQRVKAGLGKIKEKFTKGASQPASVHSADSEEPSRAASIADAGVDTLILAADMVEKIANVVNKVPLIAPVAALVSEVFQTVKLAVTHMFIKNRHFQPLHSREPYLASRCTK
ncbi:hypothetical protein DFH07DRAFT_970488 [Mycena maculata]|uniref:Uncharacterized protein n=1 Tax=Mycena maculata TaxID=230809 RepID=A0AAD7MP70_9AGAR|nr:hypothetical protein DFH07DRAFT_970488 [Mycena maculata]